MLERSAITYGYEELLKIVARDEDGKHQFKADIINANSLAAEMVAFSNSGGGQIFIGINNDGSVTGLTRQEVSRIKQVISNAASHNVHPPNNPSTENVALTEGLVLIRVSQIFAIRFWLLLLQEYCLIGVLAVGLEEHLMPIRQSN